MEWLHPLASVVTIVGWTVTAVLGLYAWCTGGIKRWSAFGLQIEMSAANDIAEATRAKEAPDGEAAAELQQEISGTEYAEIRREVGKGFQAHVAARLAGKSILWVDDRPEQNSYEIAALHKLGLRVTPVTTTESALGQIRKNGPFQLIISDMVRPKAETLVTIC